MKNKTISIKASMVGGSKIGNGKCVLDVYNENKTVNYQITVDVSVVESVLEAMKANSWTTGFKANQS